jgi:PAS domain S-box-containing protein
LIFANRYSVDLGPELKNVFVPGISYEEMIRTASSSGDFPDAAENEDDWIRKRLEYHRNPSGAFANIMMGDRHIEIREERLSNGGSIVRQTDVTDQSLAQKALRKSEERFRDFAESSSDWMWESDSEHTIVWLSESVRQHSEIPPSQIIGSTRWDGLGIELEADSHWQSLVATMDNHQRIRDFRYSRSNNEGTVLHRRISGAAFFDDAGNFLGYRGAITDITALVNAEQAEQRFLSAINTADEGLILLDPEDRLVFANQTSRLILGENGATLDQGVAFADLLRNFLDPNALALTSDEHENIIAQRLAQHRNMASEPIIVLRTNGMILEIREEILSDGSCIIFQNDITARIEAESALIESRQRFQDFAEASSDWLWETDADFRITFATGGVEGSGDLAPADFIGRTRWESAGVDVENGENWRNHIDELIAHKPFRNFRYSRVSPTGRVLHRSTSGLPFYDAADGSFKGYRGTTADITDQVEAEQRYRNLLDQSPTPMVVHDGQTIAHSADEIIGNSVLDYVHPDEQDQFLERVTRILDHGEVTPVVEHRQVRVDGLEIVVIARGVPVMWDGKRAVLGALIDITDRVRAERQYRELIESAPMALSVDDGERFIFVNQAFADMFGKDRPEDVVGRELVEIVHSDDLDEFLGRVRAVSHYRRKLPNAQIKRKRFDGGTLTALSRGVPIQWEGQAATLGIQVDISERIEAQQALEESEERFRSLVEGSRQGVLIHIDFTPVFVNAALATMFGYDSEEELLSISSALDLVAPEAREQWRNNRSARLSGMDVEDDYEFPGLHKDGSRIWIHMTVRLVNWQNRTAIQGTMIDVTRRREAEGRIRESEERFRLLTSTSPVGIFVTDADGSCEYINEAYEKMSGLAAAQASG